MKKTLSVLIFAFLFAAGPLMSQKQLYFGLGGTYLSSAIINQNNYGLFEMDYKAAFGMSGNLNIGFDFNKHIGLKLEIGLTKLGQKYEDSRENDTLAMPYGNAVYARDIQLKYLQIPLLFKYRTGGKIARFYVMAGPQFNILRSANQTYTRQDTTFSFVKTNKAEDKFDVGVEDIKTRFVSLDIMGRLDLGVDITIVKFLLLNAGLTMAYGFTDINATDFRIEDSSGKYSASHNVYGGFNLGLCFLLPVGGSK